MEAGRRIFEELDPFPLRRSMQSLSRRLAPRKPLFRAGLLCFRTVRLWECGGFLPAPASHFPSPIAPIATPVFCLREFA